MQLAASISPKERAVYQLANLSVLLHQLGLSEPLQHVSNARLCLLAILDNELNQPRKDKGEK